MDTGIRMRALDPELATAGRPRTFAGGGLLVLAVVLLGLSIASASEVGLGAALGGRSGPSVASASVGGLEACCLPDGGCVDLPAETDFCVGFFGGVPMGRGTSCFLTPCDGACCFPGEETCVEGLGFGECDEIEGVFAGFGSDCEPVPCGLPVGACCLPDGGCADGVTRNRCTLSLGGTWRGSGSSCGRVRCCPGDLSGDGAVGLPDVLLLLGEWGPCSPALACLADLDADGIVGTSDLLIVLAAFGCR